MIKVNSFLYIEEKLINIKEFDGKIPDSFYLYGVIKLDINGHEIITLKMIDLVDQLWAYIINGIIDIEEGKDEINSYFPDQAIPFSFKIDRKSLFITVSFWNNEVSVNYQEFVQAMVASFKDFYNRLMIIEPSTQEFYEPYIEDIKYLENKYGKYNLNS